MSRSRARRVLIVAYYFPPISTSGAMRPRAFARYLGEFGWDVHVVAADAASVAPRLEVDPELCMGFPHTVRIDRIGHRNPLSAAGELRAYLLKHKRPRARHADVTTRTQSNGGRGSTIAAAKERILERLFAFPDPQRDWYRVASRWGERLPHASRPDVVLATGGPWTALLVGRRLAARYGVPFVADFRDPWRRNPYRKTRLGPQAAALERSVVEAAACVVANTEELRQQFCADYPGIAQRFLTIPNGFESSNARPASESRHHGRPLHLCHFGTVYGQRNPRSLLLALRGILDSGIDSTRLRVRLVGRWETDDPETNALAGVLETHGILERHPPVSHDECQRQMAAADALLVLQPGSPLQIPGKVYEYIACGRPLLVVGGEGATAGLVRRLRLGVCCPDDHDALRNVMATLVSGELRLVAPDPKAIAQFEYGHLTRQLSCVLERVSSRAVGVAVQ